LVIMYQVIYGYARPLQFLQEPKSLSCLGHNSVPLQRRIDHNAQRLVSRTHSTVIVETDKGVTFSLLSGPIIISFVFLKLMFIWFRWDHSIRVSTVDCKSEAVPLATVSDTVVSSTNLCVSSFGLKSSMRMMKISGPSQEPCGMPPRSVTQSESVSLIFTRCWRSQRNEAIQRTIKSGTPYDFSFCRTVLWSTWSQAFALSLKWTLTTD